MDIKADLIATHLMNFSMDDVIGEQLDFIDMIIHEEQAREELALPDKKES